MAPYRAVLGVLAGERCSAAARTCALLCGAVRSEAVPPLLSQQLIILQTAERFGHDGNELGGAVTAALRHAALSTRGRMEELAERSRALHRCESVCFISVCDMQRRGRRAAAWRSLQSAAARCTCV